MHRWSDNRYLMETILEIKKESKNWNPPRKTHIANMYQCQNITSKRRSLFASFVKKYSKRVHFSNCEIKIILLLFQELSGGNIENVIKLHIFRDFISFQFDITDPFSLDGIEKAFRTKTRTKGISAEEFLFGLSIYLRGTFDERIMFCFKAFDYDADGFLKRKDEFVTYLQNSFDLNSEAIQSEIDLDEPYRETANYLFSKFIKPNSKETEISYSCFRRACNEEPLLMECLVPLFPCEKKMILFQQLLCSKVFTPSYLLPNPCPTL